MVARAWRDLQRQSIFWCVLIALIVVAVVMFTSIGEKYSAADLTRIDDALTRASVACQTGDVTVASSEVTALAAFARRDPDQAIPLLGAAPAATVGDEMRALADGVCLGHPAVSARLQRAAS